MRGSKQLVHGVLVTAMLMGCGESKATGPMTGDSGGGTGDGGAGSQDPGAVMVTVGSNFFRSNRNGSANAAVDTVAVGGKVTWKWANAGSVPHNVASVGMPSFASGAIKTGNGSTYEVTFMTPGTYRYNCAIHGNLMTGVVVVTPPVDATARVLLKDMEISRLPSPYYHFEYDTVGQVATASFASGFAMYDVTYDGGRIRTMTNNIIVNHDRLEYEYDAAGRVATVKYVNRDGLMYTVLFFTYDGEKITRVDRSRRLEGRGFVVDKTTSFSYYPDGNLLELTEHRLRIDGGPDDMTTVDHFDAYDNGINVDAFNLLHDEFFDHLVLLPGVRLQKGNPGRVTHTGDGAHYAIDYTYVYDDRNRPMAKNGELTFLTGPQAGARFESNAWFSYY